MLLTCFEENILFVHKMGAAKTLSGNVSTSFIVKRVICATRRGSCKLQDIVYKINQTF